MYLAIKLLSTVTFLLLQNHFAFAFLPRVVNSRLGYGRDIAVTLASVQRQTIDILPAFEYPSLLPKDDVRKLMRSYGKANIEDTVSQAVETMTEMKRSSVIVVDDNGDLAGIFTERDFVNSVLEKNMDAVGTKVKDVMTPREKLLTAKANSPISDCRRLMVDNKIRHLPILGNQGEILGVVSMTDIIRTLQRATLQLETANLYGDTLADVAEKSKALANELALQSGEEGKKQDTLRTAYVLAAATAGAALLQANWVHDHEWLSMTSLFILGYVGIIFENLFEFNKAAVALLMCTGLWVIYAGEVGSQVPIESGLTALSEKVSEVSEIVFFLLGAMTIVEIVDSHQGFKVVTDRINSKDKRGLMWVLGLLTFFMSAILDNLTTTIVMVSLVKKILPDADDRKLFGAMIVLAANAGGAWTPIGDVTTTMLWINGQITALPTMTGLLLPSLASTIIPIALLTRYIPEGEAVPPKVLTDQALAPRGLLVFGTGIAGLLSVPVFKALTGLPPYLGMLAALGVLWTLTDAIHAGEDREELMAPAALRKIDTSGVLFFLGILLSVGALDSAGILRALAEVLDKSFSNDALLATIIGFASALIDNVPLVAATMGMYPLADVSPDSQLWQLIAYCAGTGGSMLVIGSAAGVALMGIENVDFVWYAKKITPAAVAGYLAGIGVYVAQHGLFDTVAETVTAAAVTAQGDVGTIVSTLLSLFN